MSRDSATRGAASTDADNAMGRLTTHVLDAANGRPGSNIRIELVRLAGTQRVPVSDVRTNANGRCDAPLLEGDALEAGVYEFTFHVGDYFRSQGAPLAEPAFLDQVVLRFGVASPDEHYHVPLLVSPYSYSMYRGS